MNITNLVGIDKSADYQHKIQASFVENISSIKENNPKDSGTLGGQAVTVEISALGAEELEKVRQSWNNHPVSVLYRTDIPVSKNDEGAYRIGKVDFSEDEFETARNLVTGMTSQLKQGTLSYIDHTKMALAENLVDKCAASFSEDQRQVIVKAMKDYNSRLVDRNNELLSKSNYVQNDDESARTYWGARQVIPEAAKNEMERLFGRKPAGASAVTSVATNQELIDSLQKKVKEVDITDSSGMDDFKVFYQKLVKPAYDAIYPDKMRSDSDVSIDRDMNDIAKMVDFAKQWLR
ncbi:hypothetical protein SAMN05216390_101147 [Lachnospiraceae bacterium KH1T2]|nr:hypothetical protein SAMN05216390_101147 [Lachnospiraceae bacterium KH1T2]